MTRVTLPYTVCRYDLLYCYGCSTPASKLTSMVIQLAGESHGGVSHCVIISLGSETCYKFLYR